MVVVSSSHSLAAFISFPVLPVSARTQATVQSLLAVPEAHILTLQLCQELAEDLQSSGALAPKRPKTDVASPHSVAKSADAAAAGPVLLTLVDMVRGRGGRGSKHDQADGLNNYFHRHACA